MSQQNVNTTASESKESSVLKTKSARRPAKAKTDKAAAVAVEQALEKIEIEMIPLSRLAISPLNARRKVYVQSRIESLAVTIKNVGLLHTRQQEQEFFEFDILHMVMAWLPQFASCLVLGGTALAAHTGYSGRGERRDGGCAEC